MMKLSKKQEKALKKQQKECAKTRAAMCRMHPGRAMRAVRADLGDVKQYLTPLQPMMSAEQQQAFYLASEAIPRPTGGYTGCGYDSWGRGIVCQNGAINNVHPNMESFYSDWTLNVNYPYSPDNMYPIMQTPGGIDQILMGGGAGVTPCAEACSCVGDRDCTCNTAECGYPAVFHDCMEPVPGGKYRSLSECEAAQHLGYYGK